MRSVRSLYLFSFFSGAAALLYQVSWTRMLSLSFGSSLLSVSAVVAGFMGGMGIGAYALHRVQERVTRPLLLYALLEIGIGSTAALWTIGYAWLPQFFANTADAFPIGLPQAVFRVFCILILLALPTALMGATYPALCSVLIHDRSEFETRLGWIYGSNTVGAAAGALVAGLFLIPEWGLNATVAIGNLTNLGVGAAVLISFWRFAASSSSSVPIAGALPTTLPRLVTGTVLALSGMATLAYEVLWFRALRGLIGNSTFALSTVLVIFLLGLGIGSLALRRVVDLGRPERNLARVQLGIGLFAAFAMLSLQFLLGNQPLLDTLGAGIRHLHWLLRIAIHGGITLVLLLPATLLMGLSFPLANRLYVADLKRLGKGVGGAYLLSNMGSIAGALGAALLLLPYLGSLDGTRLVICVNLALGAWILLRHPEGGRGTRWRDLAIAGVPALLMMSAAGSIPRAGPEATLLFEREGDLGTVRVYGGPVDLDQLIMTIEGAVIGVSEAWVGPTSAAAPTAGQHFARGLYAKQVLLAHLPVVLDAGLRSALQIGLGSGTTLEALLLHEQFESVESLEINSHVVEASLLFPASRVYDDPRLQIVVEDAVHHLLRRSSPLDLIVSDGKQDIEHPGNANLFSVEFYTLAQSRLREGGLFVQWVGLGILNSDVRSLLRSMGDVFVNIDAFLVNESTLLLVASDRSLGDRPRGNDESFEAGVPAEQLRRSGVGSAAELRHSWLAGKKALLDAVGDGPRNTWDRPVIAFDTYRASRSELQAAPRRNLAMLLEAGANSGAPVGSQKSSGVP